MKTTGLNIVPISNWMITTSNIHVKEVYSQLFVGEYKPSFMPLQQVLAVGPRVEDVKVGDWVQIDMQRYMRTVQKDGKVKVGIGSEQKKITVEEMQPPLCAVIGDPAAYFKINDREIEGVVVDYDALPEELKTHSTLAEFKEMQDAARMEAMQKQREADEAKEKAEEAKAIAKQSKVKAGRNKVRPITAG